MRHSRGQRTASERTLQLLRDYESRNVTFIEPDGSWPIVWERARGVHVWDAEGKRYLDLTAAFGVAAAGHANPRVVEAGQKQMARLLHAMGDVHPHRLKAELARELSRRTFERWGDKPVTGKTIFCNSGFEAVEAALKTALLATGKPGVLAFSGAYHGLGYGALNATHREYFRRPFSRQLAAFAHFVPFPEKVNPFEPLPEKSLQEAIKRVFRKNKIGAVLIEPVQGRGGIRVTPQCLTRFLREMCEEHGALLVADEVFTGFGRTGRWFGCEHTGTVPDLICLGKALTGGFPISACIGKAKIMDKAWPKTKGEALHTSTFLGHPVGCAMALAQIKEIEKQGLVERSLQNGRRLRLELLKLDLPQSLDSSVRGAGLMAGMELRTRRGTPAARKTMVVIKEMLRRGYIMLPEGEHGNVISFTPPLTIRLQELLQTVEVLGEVIRAEC